MVYDCRSVEGQDVAWHTDDDIDYFSAYHRAYRFFVFGRESGVGSPNIEARIRRTVLLMKKQKYALVLDSVSDLNSPGFNRAVSQYWHSPNKFTIMRPGVARTGGRSGCLLLYARTEGLHRLDRSIDFAGEEVAHLGSAHSSHCLRARRWMPLNYQGVPGFATVLFPFSGKVPDVEVRTLPVTGAPSQWLVEAIEVRHPGGRDTIVLNPDLLPGIRIGRTAVTGRAYIIAAGGKKPVIVR
jgi:hypothetical protein